MTHKNIWTRSVYMQLKVYFDLQFLEFIDVDHECGDITIYGENFKKRDGVPEHPLWAGQDRNGAHLS